MSPRSSQAVAERFHAPNSGTRHFVPGRPGIACAGVPAQQGFPALVLVWDERDLNAGASATNCIERLLLVLAERWAPLLALREANVIECDSEGNFDHAQVDWRAQGQPMVHWSPLRWTEQEPRSEAAFRGMFGSQAEAALSALATCGVRVAQPPF